MGVKLNPKRSHENTIKTHVPFQPSEPFVVKAKCSSLFVFALFLFNFTFVFLFVKTL